jgi:hypothetical protein
MEKCSNRNCDYYFPKDYFITHLKYEKLYPKQKNEYEKYEKILDSLIKTELFCISCCIKQTRIICNNFNITINNYSVGYTHKLNK